MFESIVANVLNRVLGRYIANLEQNQLKLSIFSGNVELRGLKLRKESLDKLKLPIEVFEGYLGELNLKINWAALKTQPVVIEISDVYVLAGPKTEVPYDEEVEREDAHRVKMDRLETHELFKRQAPIITDDAKQETFMTQLITKIVDNLQILIKNIHIRYEDKQSNPGHPFAIGLTLAEMSARSTDANWVEQYVAGAVDRIYKLAKLNNLSLYWMPDSESLAGLDFGDFCARFRAFIEGTSPDIKYLIKPVSGVGRAVLHKFYPQEEARTNIWLQFDALDLNIAHDQYHDALKLIQFIVLTKRSLKYRSLRPSGPLTPLSRLRFAASCLLRDVHNKNKAYEWKSVLQLRDQRKAYVEAFKKKELGLDTSEDAAQLDALERSLSYEHLRWFRAIARREIHAEQLRRATQSKSSEPAQPAGWFAWIWSSGRQSGEGEGLEIAEEDVKALYDTIDYNESLQVETSLPSTAKLFGINFELGSGSVTVTQDQPLMRLQFFALIASILKRPKSLRVEVGLADLSLTESLVAGSLLPTLLKSKASSIKGVGEEPVFFVVFDQLPANPDAEYEVRLKMRPLEVCVSHQAFIQLQSFFISGGNKEAFTSFSAATHSQLQELASKTRVGLEQAITRHKAVDWFVDVEAPIVTVPLDCCDREALLFILDLGRLSIRSQLVTKKQRTELKAKLKEDLTRLGTGLYDRLDVRLNHAKLLWARSIEHFGRGEVHAVIEPIELLLSIDNALIRSPGVVPVKIMGRIPNVSIHFTDERYHGLLKLIDIFFPDKVPQTTTPLLSLPHQHITSFISLDEVLPRLSRVAIDESTGETFYDPSDEPQDIGKDSGQEVDTLNFEFMLLVEKSSMTVESAKYGGPVGLIQAEQFHLCIYDHPFDILIRVSLNSFSITDQLEGANVVFASGEADSSDSLLNVSVRLVQFGHPLFAVHYQGCRYHVDVELSSLVVLLDGKSIFTIVRFVRETFAPKKEREEEAAAATSSALRQSRSDSFIEFLFEDGDGRTKRTTPIIVKLSLNQLSVGLGRESEHVADLIFKRAGATILYTPDEVLPLEGPAHQIEMHGQLMETLLMDVDEAHSGIPFLQVEGKNRLEFWYSSGRVYVDEYRYGQRLKLLIGSPRFNYRPALLWKVCSWWQKFKYHLPLMDVEQVSTQQAPSPSRFHFDVDLSSPVIDVRRFGTGAEKLSIYLGRILATNFVGKVDDTTGAVYPSNDQADPDQVYDVKLDSIRMTVTMDESSAEQQLVQDTQAQFRVVQVFQAVTRSYANTEVIGRVKQDGPLMMTVNTHQYTLLLDRLLFLGATVGEAVRPFSTPLFQPSPLEMNPEELSVELFFTIPAFQINLVDQTQRFTEILLDRMIMHVTMRPDGELICDVGVGALSMRDTRPETSIRFVDFIVPKRPHDADPLQPSSLLRPPATFPPFGTQLDVHYERNGIGSICDVSLDSPKAVMVLNYLFAIKSFLLDAYPKQVDYPAEVAELQSLLATLPIVGEPMFLQATVKDLTAFILENPSNESSEAFHVTIPNITFLYKASCSNLDIQSMTAAFCNMDNVDMTRIDCLAPISLTMNVDGTRIAVNVTPLLMSFSYQDLEMLKSLYTQFTTLQGSKPTELMTEQVDQPIATFSSHYNLESAQLTFIDDFSDVHLPILELSLHNVSFETAGSSGGGSESKGIIGMSLEFFNQKTSHWEPIVEPWSLQVLGKTSVESGTSTLVTASKPLELVITHALLESMLHMYTAMYSRPSREPSASRLVAMPYIIVNLTGFEMSVWPEEDKDTQVTKLQHGDSVPWTFQNWRALRQATGRRAESSNKIAIHLFGSQWESVRRVLVDRPGLTVYPLRPRIDGVSHKLACFVELQPDNIKRIYLRSTCLFSNRTSFTIEILDAEGEAERSLSRTVAPKSPPPLVTHTIGPDALGALSILHSYKGVFRIRPSGLGYNWSEEFIRLDQLVQHAIVDPENPKTGLGIICQCRSTSQGVAPFYFLLSCKPERMHQHQSTYPIATIYIRTLYVLWNYLPYEVRFQIFDRTGRFELSGMIPACGSAPLQAINFDHDVDIRVEIPDADLRSKTVTRINNYAFEFKEEFIPLIDARRQETQVLLHFRIFPGGLRRVFLYSPYLVINTSGLSLEFKSGAIGDNSPLNAGIQSQPDPTAVLSGESPPKPFLLCPNRPRGKAVFGGGRQHQRGKVRFRTPLTNWSRIVNFDAISTLHYVDLLDETTKGHYNLVIYSRLGDDRFSMTKVVSIAPRYMLANRTGNLLWAIGVEGEVVEVEAGRDCPIHMHPTNESTSQATIKFSTTFAAWTTACMVGVEVRTHVKLQVDKETICLLRVDIKLQDSTTWIIVNEESTWPISIRNDSSYDLLYHQHDCDKEHAVARGTESSYSWDEPSKKDRRLVIMCYGRRRELNLNQIGRYRPMGFKAPNGEKGYIAFDVSVEGPVRVVSVTDFVRRRRSSQQDKFHQRRASEVQKEIVLNASERDDDLDDVEGKKRQEEDVPPQTVLSSFSFRLPGIGVSFVNRRPQEILYMFARDVEARYTLTEQHFTYGISIHWLQVDNQSFDWQYPIVLYPAMVKKSADVEHPFLRAALIQNRDDTHGLTHIVYAGLLLQEVNVELGDDVVRRILDFARFETVHQPHPDLFHAHELTGPTLYSSTDDSSLVYFENLQIHPVLINLTFTRAELDAEDTQTGYNPLATAINILVVTLGSITDAPLRFNLLLQEHGILSPSTLLQLIYGHYTSQAIGQLHKIVGAADFIGNPVGLFNSFSSGVHDLFYEPYQGFVSDRPQDFGIGLAKGGISLIRKTVYGLTDTMSKVTDTMGKGFSSLTFDPEFQNKRRLAQARNRPKHALHGLGYGAKLFIEGVSGGITGIVEKPIEGAQREGIEGLFKGIGKGIIGAIVKPITGVIDLTTTTIQGIRNAADMDDRDITQIRAPRVIPYDAVIAVYSEREAQGQLMLSQILGTTLFHEFYVAHLELPDSDPPSVLFLTTNRIILARLHSTRLSWQVPFSELTYCRPSTEGIQIAARTVEPRLRAIPIPDGNIQKWWCRKVDEAVAVYNESHRPLD